MQQRRSDKRRGREKEGTGVNLIISLAFGKRIQVQRSPFSGVGSATTVPTRRFSVQEGSINISVKVRVTFVGKYISVNSKLSRVTSYTESTPNCFGSNTRAAPVGVGDA